MLATVASVELPLRPAHQFYRGSEVPEATADISLIFRRLAMRLAIVPLLQAGSDKQQGKA